MNHRGNRGNLVVKAKKFTNLLSFWRFDWARLTNSSNFIDWQWHIASTYEPYYPRLLSMPNKNAYIHHTRRLNFHWMRGRKRKKSTFLQSIWVTRKKYQKKILCIWGCERHIKSTNLNTVDGGKYDANTWSQKCFNACRAHLVVGNLLICS